MKVKADTIIRTIVLALALINQILTSCGIAIIPISDDQVAEVISSIFTIGTALWAWWENNSFTKEALQADEVLKELKSNKGADTIE